MIDVSLIKKLATSDGPMNLRLDFSLEKGKVLALYGPSGIGKTSTLRMISGLMELDAGYIKVDDLYWANTLKKIHLSPQKRSVGLLFQEYALFPHMTVMQNLLYALNNEEDRYLIDEIIEVVELQGLKDKKPSALSGGQKQRVALARSIVAKPKLLLLDEPLSALDPEMRFKLQDYLKKVHDRYQLTTILVTHNQHEILKLADEVISIKKGKINFRGGPRDLFGMVNNDSGLVLTGEILNCKTNDKHCIIEILVGENILTITKSVSESKAFKVGNKIMVSFSNTDPKIYKI